MEDKPATKFSGETLVTVLVICLLIIGLFFIGFRYSERDQGALIIPGAGSKEAVNDLNACLGWPASRSSKSEG